MTKGTSPNPKPIKLHWKKSSGIINIRLNEAFNSIFNLEVYKETYEQKYLHC